MNLLKTQDVLCLSVYRALCQTRAKDNKWWTVIIHQTKSVADGMQLLFQNTWTMKEIEMKMRLLLWWVQGWP